ncbi:unnamed protein product [Rotaria socialis]
MIANDLMAFNEHVPKVNLMESILITDDSFCELYSAVWVDKKDLIVKKFKNNISNLQTLEVHYHRKFTQLDCSHFLPLLYRYENEDHSLYLMALSETTPTLSEDVVPKYSRTQSTRKSNNVRQIIEFNRYIKYALEGLANDFLSTYFYFQQDILKKENNETNTLTKKNRVENENNVTQSNIIASQPDHLTANTTSVSDIQPINNNTTTSDIQSIDINSATSKTFTNNTQSVNNNSELALGSTSTNDKIETRSYKPCAEALGLYNILSNEATAFIIHTLQPILDTLAVLSKCIQTKSADFKQLQDFISSTMLRLEELKDYSSIDYIYIIETIKKLSLVSSGIRNSRLSISNAQLTTDEVFKTKILPFIENIINNVQARFEQSTLNLLNCFMIFDMQNMNNNKDYGDEEIRTIQQHYSSDFDESIMYEWKTFRTYLLTQRQGGKLMTQREVCMKLVQDGMLKDIYPQLSLAAEIFLIAPISTATVERDFSTMNRILTKLRNRLTTKHVDQLMRISMESANTLNEEMKDEIINY